MPPLLALSLSWDVPVIGENDVLIPLRQRRDDIIISSWIKYIVHRRCHVEDALEYKLSFELEEDVICRVWPILSGG